MEVQRLWQDLRLAESACRGQPGFGDPPSFGNVFEVCAECAEFSLRSRGGKAAAKPGLQDVLRLAVELLPIRNAPLREYSGNLLDVPHKEREPLRDWSLAILGALEPVVSPAIADRGNKAVKDFLAYLETLVARRRAKPGDPTRDVLTRLILGEDNGERLTEKELLHNCIFLLNAGHETTTNLIGNGLVTLSHYPEQKQRLIDHPDLIKTSVEEMLRFESSNQLGNRMIVAPVELGGIAMPAGTPVTLCIGAANRDPAQFPDPENFDVGRTPNRHLAFATGAHQCAGMALARLEGAIAISRFLARFPKYALNGEPVRGGRVRFRGFLSVPCVVKG